MEKISDYLSKHIPHSPPCRVRGKRTVAHAQFKKREKTKMADGKIVAESKQMVLRIHERLKKEIHKMVEKKSWSTEQKREFEKKLLEVSLPYDHHE